jgi:putative ABC transport system substrate-binding protein
VYALRLAIKWAVLVSALLPALASEAVAQQPTKIYRIGFLGAGRAAAYAYRIDALRGGLRDLGYVEGKNLAFEFRWAEGQYDRLLNLAQELLDARVDVLVTHTTPGVQAAKRATATVPIVVTDVSDIVANGLVGSLARPGGNVTGSTLLAAELNAKRFQILKEALPHLRTVAVLVNDANPALELLVDAIQRASGASTVKIERVGVRRLQDLEPAFNKIREIGADAVMVVEDPLFTVNTGRVASLSLTHRLPLIGFSEFAENGALIGYGVNFPQMYRRAASFIDRILKGAKPAQIPIEQPEKFDFLINLGTAKTLGISIPQSVIVRADRLIE